GITDRPQGTLEEQFLHAEATNLQLGAGMALAHSFAPGIQGLERGLDLSLRAIDGESNLVFTPRDRRLQGQSLQIGLQPAFAAALAEKGRDAPDSFDLRMAFMKPLDPPGEGGETKEKSSDSPPRKAPLPVVERFSRETQQIRFDSSATIK